MTLRPMPTVLLYDPAVSSLNRGDHIISDSCDRVLAPLLAESFVVRVSSHLPVSRYLSYVGRVDHRFVCGSNLLRGCMNARFRQWHVTPRWSGLVGPAVLLGVGWWQYGDEPNAYTRWLNRRVLSHEATHSVRDELTAGYLRSMGFSVLNTACPTMWQLDENHCRAVPVDRASSVVSTVTDYSKDPVRDRAMLMELAGLYHHVHLWVQGSGDLDYLDTLDLTWDRFHLLRPTLESFDALLAEGDVDYVGTRLHAGIRALQHGRRSLIIGVDNRAAEKHKDFNIPYRAREDVHRLGALLSRTLTTAIRSPEDRIAGWRAQFPELRAAPA